MLIANRLWIPDKAIAILWDMDGVLLDTLGLDLTLCNNLLKQYVGADVSIPRDYIRSIFAYDPYRFWQLILDKVKYEHKLKDEDLRFNDILYDYNEARLNAIFEVNPGIVNILEDCKKHQLKMAVVSNNPTEDVRKILSASGILSYFDLVIGNDRKLKKKPAPDTYLHAADQLGIVPGESVVIEDSLVGLEAGSAAGCFTIGIATGGDSFQSLDESQIAQTVYSSFDEDHIFLRFGNVTRKVIHTPNDFVSHMVEHIAWRLGCEIDLAWHSNDWHRLGLAVGKSIGQWENHGRAGATLGMIDDGSAEVSIRLFQDPSAEITAIPVLDLDWFLSVRCEQARSGKPMIQLVEGLAEGLEAGINIRICSVEDPHHTWEGVFRSIGIALSQIFTPKRQEVAFEKPKAAGSVIGGLKVEKCSEDFVSVFRRTAETEITASIDFSKQHGTACSFVKTSSINVIGLDELLKILTEESGFSIRLHLEAVALNSSHVAMEDTALVVGRALKEILVLRMEHHGANGAGSSLENLEDLANEPVGVGISVEGRKFCKIVPFDESYPDFRKRFIIGQDVLNGLFSEDLDDFLDGLAGGLGASIIVHIRKPIGADEGWRLIFRHLGKALSNVFRANPYKKGLPPGVKATLH